MDYNFCVPCLLGLEGPISDELRRLDIPGVHAENGRVYFCTLPLYASVYACTQRLRKSQKVFAFCTGVYLSFCCGQLVIQVTVAAKRIHDFAIIRVWEITHSCYSIPKM